MTTMKRKTKGFLLTTLSVFALSACAHQGGYRYECQDPENWDKKECKEPVCIASGTCTKDVLGFDPTEEQP
jgi:hypothetical protein